MQEKIKVNFMNKILIIVLLSLSPVFCFAQNLIKVQVSGLTCEFCVKTLTSHLKNFKKISEVDIDLEKQLVTITPNSKQKISDQEITKQITDAKYEVISIQREEN